MGLNEKSKLRIKKNASLFVVGNLCLLSQMKSILLFYELFFIFLKLFFNF